MSFSCSKLLTDFFAAFSFSFACYTNIKRKWNSPCDIATDLNKYEWYGTIDLEGTRLLTILYKPVGELVCALRGFLWTVTICDKWHRRPHDNKFPNICCPEIWSFEIFQDGGWPNLAFCTTGSRSIQSAVPENPRPTLGSNTKLIGRPVSEI